MKQKVFILNPVQYVSHREDSSETFQKLLDEGWKVKFANSDGGVAGRIVYILEKEEA
jgi:hypothetical protein